MNDLIARIEAHCHANGITETTFGHKVLNNSKLVSRLRAGGGITMKSYRTIIAALQTQNEAVE